MSELLFKYERKEVWWLFESSQTLKMRTIAHGKHTYNIPL